MTHPNLRRVCIVILAKMISLLPHRHSPEDYCPHSPGKALGRGQRMCLRSDEY